MNNEMIINTYLSIITLKVSGLNAPIKRHMVAERVRKPDTYICCLQKTHEIKRHTQTKSKGLEKDIS